MEIIMLNYRPQRCCGKVVFLQASVILFTGGGCLPAPPGRPPWADTPRADTPQADTPLQMATAADGTHPTGMHSCNYESCIHWMINYTQKELPDHHVLSFSIA